MLLFGASGIIGALLAPHTWQLVSNYRFEQSLGPVEDRAGKALFVDLAGVALLALISAPLSALISHVFSISWPIYLVGSLLIAGTIGNQSTTLGVLRAKENTSGLLIFNTVTPAVRLLLCLFIIFFNVEANEHFLVLLLFAVPEFLKFVSSIIALRLGWLGVRVGSLKWPRADGTTFLLHQSSGRFARSLFELSDRLLIGALYSETALGVYLIAKRLGSAVLLVADPLVQLSFGRAAALHSKDYVGYVTRELISVAVIALLVTSLLLALMYQDQFTRLVFDSVPSAISAYRRYLFFGLFIGVITALCIYLSQMLLAARKEKFVALMDWLIVAIIGIIALLEGDILLSILLLITFRFMLNIIILRGFIDVS